MVIWPGHRRLLLDLRRQIPRQVDAHVRPARDLRFSDVHVHGERRSRRHVGVRVGLVAVHRERYEASGPGVGADVVVFRRVPEVLDRVRRGIGKVHVERGDVDRDGGRLAVRRRGHLHHELAVHGAEVGPLDVEGHGVALEDLHVDLRADEGGPVEASDADRGGLAGSGRRRRVLQSNDAVGLEDHVRGHGMELLTQRRESHDPVAQRDGPAHLRLLSRVEVHVRIGVEAAVERVGSRLQEWRNEADLEAPGR